MDSNKDIRAWIKMADGRFTAHEIAEKFNMTSKNVRCLVSFMNKEGHKVKLKP